MIKRRKNKKGPPKYGCGGHSRMSVDDVSRESRHRNYHRLRLRKIYHPQLQAKLSFSSRSWDPSKVEAATSDLASIGFAACSKRQSPLLQSYLGPLAGLVAATKCIYGAFLPNLNPHTVSDDFEVLSRAFPQHCNILNESSIVSSITMFRHASSDHHRARPAPILRNTDGCASHAPLIILPDIDEHGVPKLGVILVRTVTNAVQKPSHPKIEPLPGIRKVCPHQTLLRELNGPTPRSEKLDSLGKDASKRRRARVQLRLGRGASVNPVVGLRSPAQSYCRSSRPAMNEKFLPIQHPKIWNWGFALSP